MSQHVTPSHWLAGLAQTPLGAITCAASLAGLTGVFMAAEEEVRTSLGLTAAPLQDAPAGIAGLLEQALEQILAYLHQQRRLFDLPLDLSACTAFQQQVLKEVNRIPYGQITTYGQIAARVGGPRKVRAVGGAVGSNPLPLVIPCHRVLGSDGHLRGYSGRGGVTTKAWLLRLEGHFLVAEELG